MAFLNEWFWFFLMLPLAALSGWVIAQVFRALIAHFQQSSASSHNCILD